MNFNFLIIGAGAIGTYLGAKLAEGGYRVVFLERQTDLPQLQQRGIQLKKQDKVIRVQNPQFIVDLNQIKDQKINLVVLALKTYHLPSLLANLGPYRDEMPPLLCLQNGVESEAVLREALGQNRVIAGTVTSAVDRLEKGSALLRKERGMGLAGSHPLAAELVPVFNNVGIPCHLYTHEKAMKWSKLLTNLLGNATGAILDLTTAEVYKHSKLYRVEIEQVREALRVMRRSHIRVVNLPGIPVQVLSALIQFVPCPLSQPLLARLISGGRGGKMPSFHGDLYSGKGESEVDQLNGAVVRAGRQTGVKTPVNEFLTQTLTALIKGDISLDRYRHNPERFLRDLSRTFH